MAKKKKTRKQKILSDLRHVHSMPTIDTSSGKVVLTPSTSHLPSAQTATVTFSYAHLKKDLLKTAFVTIAIVVAELILRFIAQGV